jgi:hypothetical protein
MMPLRGVKNNVYPAWCGSPERQLQFSSITPILLPPVDGIHTIAILFLAVKIFSFGQDWSTSNFLMPFSL